MSPRLRYLSTTLALVAVVGGYALSQGWPSRPGPRPVARGAAARPEPPPAPPPSAREVLDRREALGLSRAQTARLEGLDGQWRRLSERLQAALVEEERHFTAFMTEAQGGRRASLDDIQRRSATLGELSARFREARLEHGLAAAQILTDHQRQIQGGMR